MSATRPFFISQNEINLIDSMNEELIDEMVGQVAPSLLSQPGFTGPGRRLAREMLAGTVRLAPVLHPPGFCWSRYQGPESTASN